MARKYGRFIVLIIFGIFLFKNPTQAAALVNQAGALLVEGANAIGEFATALNVDGQ